MGAVKLYYFIFVGESRNYLLAMFYHFIFFFLGYIFVMMPSFQYIVCENERDKAFVAFSDINAEDVLCISSSSLLMFDVNDDDDDVDNSSPSVSCCSAEDSSWCLWWCWCGCDTACRVFCQRSCIVWLIKFSKSSSFIELMRSISSLVILIFLRWLRLLPMLLLLLVIWMLLFATHVIWLPWFRWHSDIPPYIQSAIEGKQTDRVSKTIICSWNTASFLLSALN